MVPLRVLRDGHQEGPASGKTVFGSRRAFEQRPQLRGCHVGLIQLLLDHDPGTCLPRRVLLAEELLDGDGFQHGPVARRDANELDEKLNRIRVVVPVRAGFERLRAVVVGEEAVKLLALVLLTLVEERAHAARDLHTE